MSAPGNSGFDEPEAAVVKYLGVVARTLEDPSHLPLLSSLSYRVIDGRLVNADAALQQLREVCERRGVSLSVVRRGAPCSGVGRADAGSCVLMNDLSDRSRATDL